MMFPDSILQIYKFSRKYYVSHNLPTKAPYVLNLVE